MPHLLTFAGGIAAGYALAVCTWPAVRTFLSGAGPEVARFKSWLAALAVKARDLFGLRG